MPTLDWRSLVSAIALTISLASAQTPAPEKKYKDTAEFELYNEIAKAFTANDYVKATAGLDAWTQKYPESDYKNDRQLLYVQVFYGANQPGKAIDAAASLLALGDPATAFPDPAAVIRLLYTPTVAIQRIAEPTPDQMKTAAAAARQLARFDKMPSGMAAADWQRARKEFETTANAAQLYLAILPITAAMRIKDCAAAEALATKALDPYPNSAQVAFILASAAICLQKSDPSKASLALYEFARAATLDPALAMVDPKWQQTTVAPNLERFYSFYHGVDPDGLQQLKDLAMKSPLPPQGFAIKTKSQIAQEKQDAFEKEHPELALWLKIKSALGADDGEQYFASNLKDAAVPQLLGVVVAAKPDCRPTELHVAIRTSEDQPLKREITLKLDKAVAGKPELNTQIRWEGVASDFAKLPFNLTMEVAAAKVEGLKTVPCTSASRPMTKKSR